MPKKTRVTPATCTNCPMSKKITDTVGFCHSSLYDLGSLFKVIRDTSEKHSTAHELAGIGLYLANDWSNSIDLEREALIESHESQQHN